MNNGNTTTRKYWPQFDAYIKRVVKRAKCNLIRQQIKGQRVLVTEDDLLSALIDRGHEADYPSNHFCLSIEGKNYYLDDERLYRAIEQLPDQLVHILVLKFWNEDGEKDISRKTQISVRSCYTRRKKALEYVKRCMEELDDERAKQ